MSVLDLALTILYFNFISFGNGTLIVSLLQQHLVVEQHVLTLDQLLYAFAAGRVTPGQANAYLASVGYFIAGFPGALAAVAAIQLPGYSMLLFMRAYERYQKIAPVRRFVRSLTAASVGLILAAAFNIGRQTLTTPTAAVIFGTALALTYGMKLNVLLSIAAAGAVGLAFHAAVWGGLPGM
ncbi:MAG: chromate transporter [Chloroflexi bacterium]|nr:chromate transporter [Chloroflexota bacterium]